MKPAPGNPDEQGKQRKNIVVVPHDIGGDHNAKAQDQEQRLSLASDRGQVAADAKNSQHREAEQALRWLNLPHRNPAVIIEERPQRLCISITGYSDAEQVNKHIAIGDEMLPAKEDRGCGTFYDQECQHPAEHRPSALDKQVDHEDQRSHLQTDCQAQPKTGQDWMALFVDKHQEDAKGWWLDEQCKSRYGLP